METYSMDKLPRMLPDFVRLSDIEFPSLGACIIIFNKALHRDCPESFW
jgi:hypothetical protein